jgi:hypothetical protein
MMMKCILREEGIQLLWDIHSGICGSHSLLCSIIGKAFSHEFYWRIAKDVTMEIITKCRDCQFFQKQTTTYANPLLTVRNLRNRHRGRLAQGTRRIHISFCHYRHVHKVDGSNTNGEHHARWSGQISVEYHLQIWCSKVGLN